MAVCPVNDARILMKSNVSSGCREDHPGIVFRDGPSGRRAALAAGPDVWEVVKTLQDTGLSGEQAIAATAEWGNLTPAQVGAAVRYYADFREEIEERILLNRDEAERRRGPADEHADLALKRRKARSARAFAEYRHGDSNPGFRRERAAS
jgi:hypothetical protein